MLGEEYTETLYLYARGEVPGLGDDLAREFELVPYTARSPEMAGLMPDPILLILFPVVLVLYFMPALVASGRKHRNATAILVLNLFLGWTALGWIIALVWAFTVSRDDRRSAEPKVGETPIVKRALIAAAVLSISVPQAVADCIDINTASRGDLVRIVHIDKVRSVGLLGAVAAMIVGAVALALS